MSRLIRGSPHTRSLLRGLDGSEFPTLNLRADSRFSLPGSDLKRLVRLTAFAAARDQSRPLLTGVRWRAEGARLSLAAADGFQLATTEAKLDFPLDPFTAIVPARALEHFTRFVSDRETVSVGLGAERIVLETASLTLTCRLIEGQYPDIAQVIPRSATRTCVTYSLKLTPVTSLNT